LYYLNRYYFKEGPRKDTGDIMKKRIMGSILPVLLLSLIQPMHCTGPYDMVWTFEPRTDGVVNVRTVISAQEGWDTYYIGWLPEESWIRNVKAYIYGSSEPLDAKVQHDSETNSQKIVVTFNEATTEGLKFVVEFEICDHLIEEEEKKFIFEWYFRTDTENNHWIVVILPKDAELLEVDEKAPRTVDETGQVMLYYEGESWSGHFFGVSITFSSTGKVYKGLAENYRERGQLEQALSYYRKAVSFYARYDLYGKDKTQFLAEVKDNMSAVQKIQADAAFQEGTDAFNKREYTEAKLKYEEAQNLYTFIKDTEGEAACTDMINQCIRIGEVKKEAGELFEQGVTYYEKQVYTEAAKSFNKARTMYGEIGDTNKVSECDQWILTCDEAAGSGVFFCILGILIVLFWKKYS
jgi:hypothetical protein